MAPLYNSPAHAQPVREPADASVEGASAASPSQGVAEGETPRELPAVGSEGQPAESEGQPAALEDAAAAARRDARAAYAEGEQAFAAGRYEAALDAFERAYRKLPNPVVLLSVAESERRLGRIDAAIVHLTAFLDAAPPSDPRLPTVLASIEELRSTPATVRVTSHPPGAEVEVEREGLSTTAPGELRLPAGDHVLTVRMAGHQDMRAEVSLSPGARKELTVTLVPVSKAVAAASDEGDDNTALWIAGTVGVVGIATGSVLGFMSLSANSDFDRNPTQATADRGERLSLLADVAFGVGAMALITGAVLLFTDDSDDQDDKAPPLAVGIAPASHGAMAHAAVRF